MKFTDGRKRAEIHKGNEAIDEYIQCVANGVSNYSITHNSAHQSGVPVDLKDIPKSVEEVAELSARLVYVDQRGIIDGLLKDIKFLLDTLESTGEELDEEDRGVIDEIKEKAS